MRLDGYYGHDHQNREFVFAWAFIFMFSCRAVSTQLAQQLSLENLSCGLSSSSSSSAGRFFGTPRKIPQVYAVNYDRHLSKQKKRERIIIAQAGVKRRGARRRRIIDLDLLTNVMTFDNIYSSPHILSI